MASTNLNFRRLLRVVFSPSVTVADLANITSCKCMKEIQGKLILVRVSEPVDLSRVVCNPIQNNQEDIGSLLLPYLKYLLHQLVSILGYLWLDEVGRRRIKMAGEFKKKVGFLGGGNMAKAMAKGFITSKTVNPANIIVSAATEKTLLVWKEMGCQTTLVNKEVVEHSDVIFIAVKPHLVVQVAQEIDSSVDPSKHLIVSIAAAITTDVIEAHLPRSRVIRCLPNLACAVQCGIFAYCRGKNVQEKDVELIHKLLGTSGLCTEVKESYSNALAAVSGCGLGFVGLVMEAMSDGGVRAGLPRALSTELVTQTLIGAARLVQETGKHPAQLKDEVCSPGGTTIAGIQVLERSGLRSALIDAVDAATKRAVEIAEAQKAKEK